MIEIIQNKTLIICPNNYKSRLLEEFKNSKKLIDVKFMSMDEYRKNYLFDYDAKAILYLTNKYHMKVDNVITLINNLYYIEDKEYSSDKLNYLKNIKKELDDHDLLIYNSLFKEYLKTSSLVIMGYGNLDKFSLSILGECIIVPKNILDKTFPVYHFKTIENEVEYVFNSISDLLIKGVDINNIYLMNVNEEYISYLKRFSSFYHIPVDIASSDSLLTTIVGKYFLELINNYESKEIVDKLEIYKKSNIYPLLIEILNKYVEFDLQDVVDLIKYDLLNTNIPNYKYNNVVKIIDVDSNLVNDNDYVFLIGFNNPIIPITYNDENYITDNIKNELLMSTALELNKLSKKNTLENLKSIKNISISYKDISPFNSYYPSILLDDINYTSIDYESNYNYSDIYNKIKYTYLLDDYVKYGEYHDDLSKLYNTYGSINYRKYDNKYININKNSLLDYIDNKLTLSYSSIDNYYKCGFKYYLTNILKIDIYEETFSALIGSLFHEVLSKSFTNDFNFDSLYNSFIQNKEFSVKELFFLDKLKDDLLFIIKTIQEYRLITGFNNELYEQKINIKLSDNPLIIFKGFVDKIMYKINNNETLVSIIDYKTGSPDINIKNLKFGLSMQLPIYLYLVKNSELFSNIKFTGFYLEHILNNEIKINLKKSYIEQKKDNLKLVGYSTDVISRLEIFDSSYENSTMIKGMKTLVDGTLSKSSNALTDTEIDSIISLVDKKIKEASNNILNNNFNINPKVLNNVNLSCAFCKFNDICYKKEKDLVYLQGDDDNAQLD